MIFCPLSEVLRSGTINSRNGEQMKIRIELMNLLQKEPPSSFLMLQWNWHLRYIHFTGKSLMGKLLFYLNYLTHSSLFVWKLSVKLFEAMLYGRRRGSLGASRRGRPSPHETGPRWVLWMDAFQAKQQQLIKRSIQSEASRVTTGRKLPQPHQSGWGKVFSHRR